MDSQVYKINAVGQWGFNYDPKYHKIPKISPGAYIFQRPFLRASTSTSPRGAYIWRGDLTRVFCVTGLGGLYLEGLIHGGAYFRNFTVYKKHNLDLLLEDLLICLSFCQTHFQVFLRWVKHCLKARHWSLNQTQNKWILIKKVKETTCT